MQSEEDGSVVVIRQETPKDIAGVRHVNEQAFGRAAEADLVDRLRTRGKVMLSLVAVQDDRVVGHILFSSVTVESEGTAFPAVGLAPMAVLPELQRQGIGSRLVEIGLEECRNAGHACVVVLGHSEYYPRFGFVPASTYGITCEYDVPDEAFMAVELWQGALLGHGGTAKYQPEFNEG
ncbi:MAG: N-acetyltransferase [Acidobacteria bacterium]|nr:N-acetyltransferase [Acidobacteriota bacterium]